LNVCAEYYCVSEDNLFKMEVYNGIMVWIKYNQSKEVPSMDVSYKKLWKILIDKEMKKKDLQEAAGVSWASISKLSKNENVSMDVLGKICTALDCNIGDIVEFIKED